LYRGLLLRNERLYVCLMSESLGSNLSVLFRQRLGECLLVLLAQVL